MLVVNVCLDIMSCRDVYLVELRIRLCLVYQWESSKLSLGEKNKFDIMFDFSPKICLKLKFNLRTQFGKNNH